MSERADRQVELDEPSDMIYCKTENTRVYFNILVLWQSKLTHSLSHKILSCKPIQEHCYQLVIAILLECVRRRRYSILHLQTTIILSATDSICARTENIQFIPMSTVTNGKYRLKRNKTFTRVNRDVQMSRFWDRFEISFVAKVGTPNGDLLHRLK